jgi:N-acetylneuraminic acid mutarotase
MGLTTISPVPRVAAASTVLDGTIYVFSGRGGIAMAPIEEKGALWAFATDNRTWSQVRSMDSQPPYPLGRSYHALSSNGKDTLFLHAGCPEKGRLSDLWSFNLSEQNWTELPPAPEPARGGTSIAFSGGKLYRMNGFDGKTEQGGAVDVFDPAEKTWCT